MAVRNPRKLFLAVLLICAASCSYVKTQLASKPAAAQAQPAALVAGDFVAVCGDSITEQRLYSVDIEDYLLMCQPAPGVRTTQAGWSGEVAPFFNGRMVQDVLTQKPTVATTCYGMNDGGYGPLTPERAQMYRQAQKEIVQKFKQAGLHHIVVGSPGCVDSGMFRPGTPEAEIYNKTLGQLKDIAREVAQEEGVAFANVHDPMMDVMAKTKAKYGPTYHLAGPDGVHPDQNGHLVMAYAFLKALGCSGEIGTITVDLANSKAQASEGHKILSAKGGAVEVESRRYPFCFFGDPASPASKRGVLEFLPFNEELNRFRLVVKDAQPAQQYQVTWGPATKTFSGQQLMSGINLAAEFLDSPFSEAFLRVDKVVRKQQDFETPLNKEILHAVPPCRQYMPEHTKLVDRLINSALEKDKALADASAASVTPVRHTIRIEPVR